MISSLISDALDELKPDDLTVIMLRFYEGLTLPEVGAALEISEEAARKRVNRAVEKLRQYFGRAGFDRTTQQTKGVVITMLTKTEAVNEIDAIYNYMDAIYSAKDVDAVRNFLDKIYAPDFHLIDINGVRVPMTRDELKESIPVQNAARPPEKSRKHDIELVSLEGNRAVVFINLRVEYFREKDSVWHLNAEHTWVKNGSDWEYENSRAFGIGFTDS